MTKSWKDLIHAFFSYHGTEQFCCIRICGQPRTKNSYPVLSNGRRFNPHKQLQVEMGWEMRSQYAGEPLNGPVSVIVLFCLQSDRPFDLDNGMKLVGDSGKGILWEDDRQIVGTLKEKCVCPGDPGTWIAFGRSRRGSKIDSEV